MFTKIFDLDPQGTNLFTNVTKLERFVDQEVRVSSEFDKSDKSPTNTFRQGENLRGPQIRLFQEQIPR